MKLAGARVWITGASSGIGEALVAPLLRAGARVAISARRGEELERIAAAHAVPQRPDVTAHAPHERPDVTAHAVPERQDGVTPGVTDAMTPGVTPGVTDGVTLRLTDAAAAGMPGVLMSGVTAGVTGAVTPSITAGRGDARILAVTIDVTDPVTVSDAVRRIETEWGGIDLAILNAGSYHVGTDRTFKADDFIHTIQVNLFGAMYATDAVLPGMLRRGSGRIAVTASLTGRIPLPRAAAYGASKAALAYAFESMRFELEPRGVGVTVIQPGFVRTPMTRPNRFWMPAMLEADAAAEIIVRGLARDHDDIVFPRRLAWPVQAASRLPLPLYRRLVRLALRLGAY